MEFQNDNGTVAKNGTATDPKNVAQTNGTTKKVNATNGKSNSSDKVEATPVKTAPPAEEKPAQEQAQPKAEEQPKQEAKPVVQELSLEAKLKTISDLNRKTIQRLALIGRMHELESFEVKLVEENDELESNPYQGCKLIIKDDRNREFVTNTPNLIRMVSQFIFDSCEQKLNEIESAIVFPYA
jgi:CHAT domain-containing protein